eukprot:SAG22_NODE_429_length_10587_cov_22.842582_6_plen_1131_part_00
MRRGSNSSDIDGSAAGGSLIVAGFTLGEPTDTIEKRYLLDRLVRYAMDRPEPQTELVVASHLKTTDEDLTTVPHARNMPLDGGKWAINCRQPAQNCPCSRLPGCTCDQPSNATWTRGTAVLPGAWQAQGFGEPAFEGKIRAQSFGNCTYSRTVSLPANWTGAGSRLFWIAERVHRQAVLRVNGLRVGQHIGYLSDFEVELTRFKATKMLHLELTISTARAATDGLWGSMDGYPLGQLLGAIGVFEWGGTTGHLYLQLRSARGWIRAPHIQHSVSPSLDRATVSATVTLGGDSTAADRYGLLLRARYTDSANSTVASHAVACGTSSTTCTVPNMDLLLPQLWSPGSPAMCTAVLELLAQDGAVLDRREVDFGLRRFETTGYKWLLNGKRLFLHGYGDDSVYPTTLAPPVEKAEYTRRLKLAKSLGFNFVRHHSHILPLSYFEVACEVGIFVSVEFPMLSGNRCGVKPGCQNTAPPDRHNGTDCGWGACVAVTLTEWRAAITAVRNLPCVFSYSGGSEGYTSMGGYLLDGKNLAQHLYDSAKLLDPGRPVVTVDGIYGGPNHINHEADRRMLWCDPTDASVCQELPFDFRSIQTDLPSMFCNVLNFSAAPYTGTSTPITHCLNLSSAPPVPVIAHEFGNLNSWPMIDEQLRQYRENEVVAPFHLTEARERLQRAGLLHENELWTAASNSLFLTCWKLRLEALRKTKFWSGLEWWLLQDYWAANNGIVSVHFIPKHRQAGLDTIRSFNAPIMLLVAETGDNLPLPPGAARLRRQYSSGETLKTSIWVSHVGEHSFDASSRLQLRWDVAVADSNALLCSGHSSIRPDAVLQGELARIGTDVSCTLPLSSAPVTVVLQAALTQPAHAGSNLSSSNMWRTRVFPRPAALRAPAGVTVRSTRSLLSMLPVGGARPMPAHGTAVPTWVGTVLVSDTLDSAVVDAASRGAEVLLLNSGSATDSTGTRRSPPLNGSRLSGVFRALSTEPAQFKTDVWTGSVDADGMGMGTVVYTNRTSVFEQMVVGVEQWPDASWAHLLHLSQAFVLDSLQSALPPANVSVLVRQIDLMSNNSRGVFKSALARSKSLLFRAAVGHGTVTACGMRVLPTSHTGADDAASWVLRRLLLEAMERVVAKPLAPP